MDVFSLSLSHQFRCMSGEMVMSQYLGSIKIPFDVWMFATVWMYLVDMWLIRFVWLVLCQRLCTTVLWVYLLQHAVCWFVLTMECRAFRLLTPVFFLHPFCVTHILAADANFIGIANELPYFTYIHNKRSKRFTHSFIHSPERETSRLTFCWISFYKNEMFVSISSSFVFTVNFVRLHLSFSLHVCVCVGFRFCFFCFVFLYSWLVCWWCRCVFCSAATLLLAFFYLIFYSFICVWYRMSWRFQWYSLWQCAPSPVTHWYVTI